MRFPEQARPTIPSLSRRSFLRGSGALAVGMPRLGSGACSPADHAAILILLVGGPSQLETFDPKPEASGAYRGPFRSIATSLPTIRVVEHLPGIARRLHRCTLVRTLYHDAAPIHETGLQTLQAGSLSPLPPDSPRPSLGARLVPHTVGADRADSFVVLPDRIGATGVDIPKGQEDAPTTSSHDVLRSHGAASDRDSFAYGSNGFGLDCLRARQLVEAGARMVVVNMFTTVFAGPSWDAHGRAPFATFADYERFVLPAFDRAFSALIDDLDARGRLGSTLVVASGEFGRSPRINDSGGRDHWPRAWSALLAGGPARRGVVIGATDRVGGEPIDEPFPLHHLHDVMAAHLGVELDAARGRLPIA